MNSLVVNPLSSVIDVDNTTGVATNRQAPNKFAQGLSKFVGVSFYKSGVSGVANWVAGGGDDVTVETALALPAYANKFDSASDSFPGLTTLPTTALTGGQNISVVPNSGSAAAGAVDSVLDDGFLSANASIQFVNYRGAFATDTTELWTSGWTAAALANVIQP